MAPGQVMQIGREVGAAEVREELATRPTVSRRHCEVTVGSDGRAITVRDLDSMNGTRLNAVHALVGPGEIRAAVLPATVFLGESVSLRFE